MIAFAALLALLVFVPIGYAATLEERREVIERYFMSEIALGKADLAAGRVRPWSEIR